MLREKIHEEIIKAMKAREAGRLETIRYVWSGIKNIEIDAKHELADEEIIKYLMTEVKKRKESVEQFRAGNREELATEEEGKIKIIQEFLPAMMSEEEIGKIVDEVLASGLTDFGRVMGQVMSKVRGKAEGSMVTKVVKEKLG